MGPPWPGPRDAAELPGSGAKRPGPTWDRVILRPEASGWRGGGGGRVPSDPAEPRSARPSGKGSRGERAAEAALGHFPPQPGGRGVPRATAGVVCQALYLKECGAQPGAASSAFPPSPALATVSGRGSWTWIPPECLTRWELHPRLQGESWGSSPRDWRAEVGASVPAQAGNSLPGTFLSPPRYSVTFL